MNLIGKSAGVLVLGIFMAVMAVPADPVGAAEALDAQLVQQGRFCMIKRDEACAAVCVAAIKAKTDAGLTEKCNTEYQRVSAAFVPPTHAEDSMSLEMRIALMKDKAAYCQSKYSTKLPRATSRSVDICRKSCVDKRAADTSYPLARREDMVTNCETVYYGVVKKLGK